MNKEKSFNHTVEDLKQSIKDLKEEIKKDKRIKRKRERKLRELAFDDFGSRENFEKEIDRLISKAEEHKSYIEYIIKTLKREKKRILKLMKKQNENNRK